MVDATGDKHRLLKKAVDASDTPTILSILKDVEKAEISLQELKNSDGLGITVAILKKHSDGQIVSISKALIKRWKRMAKEHDIVQGSTVAAPAVVKKVEEPKSHSSDPLSVQELKKLAKEVILAAEKEGKNPTLRQLRMNAEDSISKSRGFLNPQAHDFKRAMVKTLQKRLKNGPEDSGRFALLAKAMGLGPKFYAGLKGMNEKEKEKEMARRLRAEGVTWEGKYPNDAVIQEQTEKTERKADLEGIDQSLIISPRKRRRPSAPSPPRVQAGNRAEGRQRAIVDDDDDDDDEEEAIFE